MKHTDVKNDEKWRWDFWNYTLNYTIYRCINNKYTPKNGDFFFEKTMKAYSKAVILSLKIFENILKFYFLMGEEEEGGLDILTIYASFLKRSFINVKNDEGMVIYNHAKIPLKEWIHSMQNYENVGKFTA